MLLEMDYGNTRLKWRLLDAKNFIVLAKGAVVDAQHLVHALQDAGCGELVFCRMCSVRGTQENAQLLALIKDNFGIGVHVAQSQHRLAGVTNGYQYPAQLGIDRWLAIVAARAKVQGACVVIDCGTAITVDFLAADGMHLGGYIAPGLRLLESVLNSCSALNSDAQNARSIQYALGSHTQSCIQSGIGIMAIGFIKEVLVYAQDKFAGPFTVLCTGGDSSIVATQLVGAVVQEDLVFAGLALACPYTVME